MLNPNWILEYRIYQLLCAMVSGNMRRVEGNERNQVNWNFLSLLNFRLVFIRSQAIQWGEEEE